MSNSLPIQVILVPQGAEYKAVCKGLRQINSSKPSSKPSSSPIVLPIPVGATAVSRWLELWRRRDQENSDLSNVLVMGLCGSLDSRYGVGDVVLYEECVHLTSGAEPNVQLCDRAFTHSLYARLNEKLPEKVRLVNGLTIDRFIHAAQEKRFLGQTYETAAVDMEGSAVLQRLNQDGVAVAMLRVISDDCHHDMPDLTTGIGAEGVLLPFPLAIGLMRQPIAAVRLIQGSLRGLKALQNLTTDLFTIF